MNPAIPPLPALDAIARAYVALIQHPDDPKAWAHWREVLATELGRAKKVQL